MKKFKYTNNELREILIDFPLKVNESGTQVETIPVSGTGWIEGKEYVDGKDFERQWEIFSKLRKEWTETDEVAKDVLKRKGWETRQAAVLKTYQFPGIGNMVSNLTEKMEDEGDESYGEELVEITEEKEEKGVCRMCKNETEFADESLCDACWDEEILKDAKEAQIKERKQEWDWLGWLQARIPELKKSQNVFWLKQCVNDLLSQSQPYKELSEGEKKDLSDIGDEDVIWIAVKCGIEIDDLMPEGLVCTARKPLEVVRQSILRRKELKDWNAEQYFYLHHKGYKLPVY